jgi:hypothetical protein
LGIIDVNNDVWCMATYILAIRMSIIRFNSLYEVPNPSLIQFYHVICVLSIKIRDRTVRP